MLLLNFKIPLSFMFLVNNNLSSILGFFLMYSLYFQRVIFVKKRNNTGWTLISFSPTLKRLSSNISQANLTLSCLKKTIKASPFNLPCASLYNFILGPPVRSSSRMTPHLEKYSSSSWTVVSEGKPDTYIPRFTFFFGGCGSGFFVGGCSSCGSSPVKTCWAASLRLLLFWCPAFVGSCITVGD